MPLLRTRRPLSPAGLLAAILVTTTLIVCLGAGGAGASKASQKAQAKRDLLILSDMPAGWSVEKGSSASSSNNFPGAKQLAGCIGVPSRLIDSNSPEVDSPYFQNAGGSLEVQDSVTIFPSAKAARTEFATVANSKTPACMTTIMNGPFKTQMAAAAGPGASLGTISVARASSTAFARGTSAMVMTVPITAESVSLTAHLVVVYCIKGKLGQQIEFNSYGVAFPSALTRSLTAAAIHKL